MRTAKGLSIVGDTTATQRSSLVLPLTLLACVADPSTPLPSGSDADTDTDTQSDTAEPDLPEDTDTGDQTHTPGGCIDADGRITRPFATGSEVPTKLYTFEVDGSSFVLEVSVPGTSLRHGYVANNAEQIVSTVVYEMNDGDGYVDHTRVTVFDRSTGEQRWSVDLVDYDLSSLLWLSDDGTFVTQNNPSYPQQAVNGVMIEAGEVTGFPAFQPLGPRSADGWIRGKPTDAGYASPNGLGFFAPDSDTVIELEGSDPWSFYLPPNQPEQIEYSRDDVSAWVLAELDVSESLPIPELAGSALALRDAVGRYRLISGFDISETHVGSIRLDVETGERLLIEPPTLAADQSLLECTTRVQQLTPDGQIAYVLTDSQHTWLALHDPETDTWTDRGRPMVDVNFANLSRHSENWWTIRAGEDPRSCPPNPSEPPGPRNALSGNSKQLLEMELDFVHPGFDWYSSWVRVDPTAACLSWTNGRGGWTVLDLHDFDALTDGGGDWWLWL